MRIPTLRAVLSLTVFLASCANPPPAEKADAVEKAIQELEGRRSIDPAEDYPAIDAAIDHLRRVRDRRTWPIVSTPVELATLTGTWVRDSETAGFRQRMVLDSPGGGEWTTSVQAHPFTFSWLVEGKRLRMLLYEDYRKDFNYQIVERTYEYEVRENRLTLRRAGETLTWTRSAK